MKTLLSISIVVILLTNCSPEYRAGWIEMPVPDQYGEDSGNTFLQVYGQELSSGLKEAVITYATIDDLISGGQKTMFTIMLNGKPSSESVIVETTDKKVHEFNCYDGIIFNIDNEERDLDRMIELMNYEKLMFRQGKHSFTISTKGFRLEEIEIKS